MEQLFNLYSLILNNHKLQEILIHTEFLFKMMVSSLNQQEMAPYSVFYIKISLFGLMNKIAKTYFKVILIKFLGG